jgi:hypothetical protein
MNERRIAKWLILVIADLVVFTCAFGMYPHHDVLREKPYLLGCLLGFIWVYYRFFPALVNYVVGLEENE